MHPVVTKLIRDFEKSRFHVHRSENRLTISQPSLLASAQTMDRFFELPLEVEVCNQGKINYKLQYFSTAQIFIHFSLSSIFILGMWIIPDQEYSLPGRVLALMLANCIPPLIALISWLPGFMILNKHQNT